jgi:hypothetical protein
MHRDHQKLTALTFLRLMLVGRSEPSGRLQFAEKGRNIAMKAIQRRFEQLRLGAPKRTRSVSAVVIARRTAIGSVPAFGVLRSIITGRISPRSSFYCRIDATH